MLHYFRNFLAIPDIDTREAVHFFEVNPSSHLQLEFQTFALTGQKREGVLDELSQIMSTTISSGVRMKFCVRVKLFKTNECMSIVAKLLESGRLRAEQNKILRKKILKEFDENQNDHTQTLAFDSVRRSIHELQKGLRVDVLRYVKSAKQENVVKEDTNYAYRPLESGYVFFGLQRMIADNKNPIMTFLCTSPSLCSDTQEIPVYVTL